MLSSTEIYKKGAERCDPRFRLGGTPGGGGDPIMLPDANNFRPGPNGNVPPTPGLYASIPYFEEPNVAFTPAIGDAAGDCFYSTPPPPNTTRNLLTPGWERLNPEEAPNQ